MLQMLSIILVLCLYSIPVYSKKCATNPLDPLTATEIEAAAALVKNSPDFPQDALFVSMVLQEPSKKKVLAGEKIVRKAQVLLYVNGTNQSYEVIVDVCKNKILSFNNISPDIPPMDFMNPPERFQWPMQEILEAVADNAQCVEAFAKRGISREQITDGTILTLLNAFEVSVEKNKCSCCPEISLNPPDGRFFVAAFSLNFDILAVIDGFLVVLDVTHKKIVKVIDEYVVPLPKLIPDPVDPPTHQPLKPLCITMPEGPSYTLNDNLLAWDNWKMRLSWNPRTGVQLYQLTYKDHDVDRSVLYKMSVSEAMVHYNTPRPIFFRNFASIDSFGYPILSRLNSLELGKDVPAYAQLLDIPEVALDGSLFIRNNVIGIYEQDGDLIYRGPNVGARGRQLCVRFMFTGVIYLWVFTWVFNQDGTIQPSVDVFGRDLYMIQQTSNEWGELISKNQFAPNHTHSYVFRLDFDVDGVNNTVIKENFFPINSCKRTCCKKPCKSCGGECRFCSNSNAAINRCGQTVDVVDRELKRELDAIGDIDCKSNTGWQILNPERTNRLGENTGYEIVPQSNQRALATDWSWVKRHLAFLKHQVYVTRYHDNEQFGAGNFPLQKPNDVGLGAYVKDNEEILNKDIVFWYTINFFHTPHSDDFPFVTGLRQSFLIAPHNFFEFNPAVSVPNPCS